MAILSDRTGILGAAPAVYLSVSVSPQAAGSTSPSGSNKESIGATVPVTLTTNPGYNFDHWELDGVNVGTANPYTVTMNTSHTLVAVHSNVVYLSVTSSPEAGGTTSPSGSTQSYVGATIPVTATPNPGYALSYWELDGVNVGSVNPYTVTMNTSHTLVAIYVVSGLVSGVVTKPSEIFPNPQISESVYSLTNVPLASDSISESVYSLTNVPLASDSISESVIVTNS